MKAPFGAFFCLACFYGLFQWFLSRLGLLGITRRLSGELAWWFPTFAHAFVVEHLIVGL
jgi:hypothetical protein